MTQSRPRPRIRRALWPLGLILACATTPPSSTESLRDYRAAIDAGRLGEYPRAIELFDRLIEDPEMDPALFLNALLGRAWALALSRRPEEALRDFNRVLERAPSVVPARAGRAIVASHADAPEVAARDLTWLASTDASVLQQFHASTFNAVITGLLRAGDEELARTTSEVVLAAYPEELVWRLDGVRYRHAELLARRGAWDESLAELSALTFAQGLLFSARLDRTFEPLWTDARFDSLTRPEVASRRELERVAELAERSPLLEVAVARMRSHLRSGDAAGAVAIAEDALSRFALFADVGEHGPWLHDTLAQAYWRAGDGRRAREQFEVAVASSGATAVPHQINFATFLAHHDEWERALELANAAEAEASDYGRMWILRLRALAHHDAGEAEARDAVIEQMRALGEENPEALTRTLLLVGRLDEAADHVVSRLGSAHDRAVALRTLQAHPLAPTHSELDVAIETGYARLRELPRVRAALESVGRIEPCPFPR